MNRVWVFADWKLPDAADLQLIRQLGLTDVVLGLVTTESPTFKPTYAMTRIKQSATQLKEIGVRVHVMSWIRRRKDFICDCAAWMIQTCAEIKATSGLLDAEADWHKGAGISSENAAKLVSSEFSRMPCSLGVTGLSTLHQTVRPLLAVCDYGLGQAYSIWTPGGGEHWSHSKATEPYDLQLSSWDSWSRSGKPLVMGLSNYYAARPKRWGLPAMSAEDSMREALRGAETAGAAEVAYWSLKWFKGNGASRQIARRIVGSISKASTAPENHDAEAVQWLLVKLGYNLGKTGPANNGVDGKWRTKSQKALDDYRTACGLKSRGKFVLEDVTSLVNALRKC